MPFFKMITYLVLLYNDVLQNAKILATKTCDFKINFSVI